MSLLVWDDNHPQPGEYAKFYRGYIDSVTSPNVIEALIQQGQQVYSLIQKLTPNEATHRYLEGKWTVKEVIGHLIDTERVMAYRALCISRGDQTPLPGFDQDEYVAGANFNERDLQNFSTEYDALRNANISLFNSFSEQQTQLTGTANNATVSVRALAYIIAGHEKHHLNILKEKYGLDVSGTQNKS